jgi:hypothetical protein
MHVNLLHPHSHQQPIEHLVIQSPSVRDLVGFDEDRARFRGVLLGQVLS